MELAIAGNLQAIANYLAHHDEAKAKPEFPMRFEYGRIPTGACGEVFRRLDRCKPVTRSYIRRAFGHV